MKTYAEQMQAIVTRYIESGEPWPASTHEIAAWAIRTRRWEPPHPSMVDMSADQLARAMREDYITDPQGRRVRSKHAARVKRHGQQITLWADIRNADRRHMEMAFQQRRLRFERERMGSGRKRHGSNRDPVVCQYSAQANLLRRCKLEAAIRMNFGPFPSQAKSLPYRVS